MRTDGLTGLANRRSFDAHLREAFGGHSQLAVLLINIDHFKGYNDALGHLAGDECLRQTARVIGEVSSGVGAFAARYGGEEFAIIFTGATEASAMSLAETVCRGIRQLALPHPSAKRAMVTVSVGVAAKSEQASDETTLVRDADIAFISRRRADAFSASLHLRSRPRRSAGMRPASREKQVSLRAQSPFVEGGRRGSEGNCSQRKA